MMEDGEENDTSENGVSLSRETQAFESEFIKTYEQLPVLWDISHLYYTHKDKRDAAIDILLKIMRKWDGKATRATVKQKINILRSCYRKELRKRLASKTIRPDGKEIYQYIPKNWKFHALSFLRRRNGDIERIKNNNIEDINLDSTNFKVTFPKKTPLSYSPTSLASALKDIREKGRGIRETCKKYGIPRSTVQDRLSGKRTDAIQNRGPDPVLGLSLEKQIVQWMKNITQCGFWINKQELLNNVQKVLKDHQTPNPFKDDRPGQTWYVGFLKRNPEILMPCALSIAKARACFTEQNIREWFRALEEFLSESLYLDILENPERIFIADQRGFSLCSKFGTILGPKNAEDQPESETSIERENLTAMVNFNAAGQICPPVVVFPYLRTPKVIVDSTPQDWSLGRSSTGLMTNDVFFEYIVNDFNTWLEKNNIQKPVLLLMDANKSYMSLSLSTLCEQQKIILYALPPQTEHIRQPANISVFAPLKANWENIVQCFLSKPENLNCVVTKANFCQLLKHYIEDSQMERYIKSVFGSCGLYPFNPHTVDYTKVVPKFMGEPTQPKVCQKMDITNEDLATTQKVISYLTPVLKNNNVDVKLILNELEKLKETESRQAKELLETRSDNQTHAAIVPKIEYDDSINSHPESVDDMNGADYNDTYCSTVSAYCVAELSLPIKKEINCSDTSYSNVELKSDKVKGRSLLTSLGLRDKDPLL